MQIEKYTSHHVDAETHNHGLVTILKEKPFQYPREKNCLILGVSSCSEFFTNLSTSAIPRIPGRTISTNLIADNVKLNKCHQLVNCTARSSPIS